MECPCGASFNTTSTDTNSQDLRKRFPHRNIPEGWSKIMAVEGQCKCTRFHLNIHLIEKSVEQSTSSALW